MGRGLAEYERLEPAEPPGVTPRRAANCLDRRGQGVLGTLGDCSAPASRCWSPAPTSRVAGPLARELAAARFARSR